MRWLRLNHLLFMALKRPNLVSYPLGRKIKVLGIKNLKDEKVWLSIKKTCIRGYVADPGDTQSHLLFSKQVFGLHA